MIAKLKYYVQQLNLEEDKENSNASDALGGKKAK